MILYMNKFKKEGIKMQHKAVLNQLMISGYYKDIKEEFTPEELSEAIEYLPNMENVTSARLNTLVDNVFDCLRDVDITTILNNSIDDQLEWKHITFCKLMESENFNSAHMDIMAEKALSGNLTADAWCQALGESELFETKHLKLLARKPKFIAQMLKFVEKLPYEKLIENGQMNEVQEVVVLTLKEQAEEQDLDVDSYIGGVKQAMARNILLTVLPVLELEDLAKAADGSGMPKSMEIQEGARTRLILGRRHTGNRRFSPTPE